MKLKFFSVVIALLLILSLSGCSNDAPSVQSEITSLQEASSEISEESSPRESWKESYVNDNEAVTFQYLNHGDIMIKTIERFNFVDVLISKDEYILENEIPLKKTFWEYRDDGEIEKIVSENQNTDGTYRIIVTQNDFEKDMYSYSEYIYSDDTCEKLLYSSSLYKSISNGNRLVEKTIGTAVQNGYSYSTETLIYYKNDTIHHYAITKTALNDEKSEYSIYDSEKNNIITYYYTKEKEDQSIRCYREKGFIQVDITETLLTYYESNDGVTKILVGEIEINPETGKQKAKKYNKDAYTAREANRIMEKYEDLYDAAMVFKNDVDYTS